MTIAVASPSDAPAIVAVIRAAFALEAARYGVAHLPPMLETPEQLIAAMRDQVVLKAEENGRVVGTVRGRVVDDTCEVGRLAVDPERVGRGIAQALMRELEQVCPSNRYVLFTGSDSAGPLHIYRKLGYAEVRRERVAETVELVHMEKRIPRDPRTGDPT